MSLGTDLPAGLALLDSYASPQQERSQRGGKRFKLVVLNEGVATARQTVGDLAGRAPQGIDTARTHDEAPSIVSLRLCH